MLGVRNWVKPPDINNSNNNNTNNDKDVLTQGDLAGEGHGHQQQRQAHRHELDDLVQGQLQLQQGQPTRPVALLEEGVRQHGPGGLSGDGHGGLVVWGGL